MDSQRRQVAYKTCIKELVEGSYVKQEGWQPNYILTKYGKKISRVNLMATVITIQSDKTPKTMLVDDGTGSITLRSFEETKLMDWLDVGDLILIIGRPKEFGESKYIVPEILKKITNTEWIKVRQKELQSLGLKSVENEIAKTPKYNKPQTVSKSPKQTILELIPSLDKGDGADIEEIIKATNIDNCEKYINLLLQEGDIFEIKKGRLKILE